MRSSFVFLRALKPYKVKCFKGGRPPQPKNPTPLHLKSDTPYRISVLIYISLQVQIIVL